MKRTYFADGVQCLRVHNSRVPLYVQNYKLVNFEPLKLSNFYLWHQFLTHPENIIIFAHTHYVKNKKGCSSKDKVFS
jgi:hypothetical protein